MFVLHPAPAGGPFARLRQVGPEHCEFTDCAQTWKLAPDVPIQQALPVMQSTGPHWSSSAPGGRDDAPVQAGASFTGGTGRFGFLLHEATTPAPPMASPNAISAKW